MIDTISVKNFKSIEYLHDFSLGPLNVLIGANGAGKSNLLDVFHLLSAIANRQFGAFVASHGGPQSLLFRKLTKKPASAEISLTFDSDDACAYKVEIHPCANGQALLSDWVKDKDGEWVPVSAFMDESLLDEDDPAHSAVLKALTTIGFYHFRDVSAMRKASPLQNCMRLESDGSNIAAVLLHLKETHSNVYRYIRDAVRVVLPFFDDFVLDSDGGDVSLTWKQKTSPDTMKADQLSDASLCYIALAVALLSSEAPDVLVFDEPELGLGPFTIPVIADLIKAASHRGQIIVATQSPAMLNDFNIEDLVVVNRKDGASTFSRLDPKEYGHWLEDCPVGELWARNIIKGGPSFE